MQTVIASHPDYGQIVHLKKRYNDAAEELEFMTGRYSQEIDAFNKLKMYIGMVMTKPRRNRVALLDPYNAAAFEYMDEVAVTALPSAMDAAFVLMSRTTIAEQLLMLLGSLTPVEIGTSHWLKARRGFRAKIAVLMKLLAKTEMRPFSVAQKQIKVKEPIKKEE